MWWKIDGFAGIKNCLLRFYTHSQGTNDLWQLFLTKDWEYALALRKVILFFGR